MAGRFGYESFVLTPTTVHHSVASGFLFEERTILVAAKKWIR
jgi:hypothetical protein